MSRSILIVLAVLLHSFLMGQNKFHRGYPFRSAFNQPDSSVVNLAGLQLKDGAYLSLDGVRSITDTAYHYLILTALKPKGDIKQSWKIDMQDKAGILSGTISMFQAKSDSVFVSFTTNGANDKRVLLGLDDGLRLSWSMAFNGSVTDAGKRTSHLLTEGIDTLLYELCQVDRQDSALWYVNQLNSKGGIRQSFKYNQRRLTGNALASEARDFRSTSDTGFVWTGRIQRNATGNSAMMVKLNDTLTASLATTYLPSGFQHAEGLKVLQADNTYFLAGRMGNALNAMDQSFILQADLSGKIIWSKKIDDKISKKSIIDGLIQDKDGSIVVSGKLIIRDTTEAPFILKMKQNGQQDWFVLYDRAKAHFNLNGNLFETGDNGYGYYQTDVDDEMSGKLKMGLIKTDDKGITGCEVADTNILFITHLVAVDTLLVQRVAAQDTMKEVKVNQRGFNGFDIPVLQLEERKFCRNEPINLLLEAGTEGAVAYLWSDGSTKDTLRVFKTGEFSVTVTIDDKYCFMLCDTSTLDYYDLPNVAINIGSQVCINTPYQLIASGNSGKEPYSFVWNTGATGRVITPSVTGAFRVTITDDCDEKAEATINVGSFIWLGPPVVEFDSLAKVCKDSVFIIIAKASGGGGLYSYLWDTGETIDTLKTSVLGTHMVTVTDNCGRTGVASITVDSNFWFPLPTVTVVPGGTVCKGAEFLLSAAGSPAAIAPFTYKWNNGSTDAVVKGTELGTYIVTVTDKCGNTTSRATVVNESIWNPAPSVEIEPSEENSFCRTGKVGLIARAAASGNNNGIVKYEWSAGNSTSNQVLVDGEGKYTVTVTDACNLTATDEYLTGELGIACLRFPRIFFATDSVAYEGNALFGAINKCGVDSTEVKEYELHVSDRWGKEVFSTTDVTETWDARLPDSTNSGPGNTDKYPPDVYVWYARYKVGEFCAFEGKGEVTLFW